MADKQTLSLSRRNLLRGLGVSAAGLAIGSILNSSPPILAQVSSASATLATFYRFNLGLFEVTVVSDGVTSVPVGQIAANAVPEELTTLLIANNLDTETTRFQLNIVLVNTGDRLVLIDTGDLTGFAGPATGKLVPTLNALGIAPEDINDVIISHWHWDHMGGMTTNGQPTFPNAQYHFSQIDYDFVKSNAVPEPLLDFAQVSLAQLAPIEAVDGLLTFYGNEDEVVSGIQAVHTPGHSPGHYSFLIESEGEQLLLVVDAILHPQVSVQQPQWFGFIEDPIVSVETRQSLMTRLADEQIPMLAYHFPFPGIGYIARVSDGFRYIASQ
ncbi:MAG: MBL fold metallo-hydrolase [Anaerolineae bacterium]